MILFSEISTFFLATSNRKKKQSFGKFIPRVECMLLGNYSNHDKRFARTNEWKMLIVKVSLKK